MWYAILFVLGLLAGFAGGFAVCKHRADLKAEAIKLANKPGEYLEKL